MNIIVIISDTFRYDHLGANGNAWIKTPELDVFSRMAVNFDNYYVSSFPTIPTRTDWFTGRYGFPFYGWRPLDTNATILAGELASSGYINQLIVDCPHMMNRGSHFDRGFHGWDWVQEGDTPATWLNHEVKEVVPNSKTRRSPKPFGGTLVNKHLWQNRWWDSEEDTFVARTCRKACHWLEHNHKAEKFFLWVDCFDVHEPWDPPEYLMRLYDPDYDGPRMMHPNYGRASDYSKAELKNMQANYAGEVTLVSKHVGRVLRMIEDLQLFDNSVVVFMADHGMYLGEHNRTGKTNISESDKRGSWPLYSEVAHIPMLFHAPGVKGGRRVKDIVQPPDIMPTLLDLAGAKVPDVVHGRSLKGLLCGRKAETPLKAAVSSPHLLAGQPKLTVTDRRWSAILSADGHARPELYDRKTDPSQRKNLAKEESGVLRRLHREAMRFMERVGAGDKAMERVTKACS
jgi:arylsulfatase A-like enzyme